MEPPRCSSDCEVCSAPCPCWNTFLSCGGEGHSGRRLGKDKRPDTVSSSGRGHISPFGVACHQAWTLRGRYLVVVGILTILSTSNFMIKTCRKMKLSKFPPLQESSLLPMFGISVSCNAQQGVVTSCVFVVVSPARPLGSHLRCVAGWRPRRVSLQVSTGGRGPDSARK